MNKPELLAPAGNFEALKVAVNSGADAIYVGAMKYSARKSAKNFTIDEIKEAIEYCHLKSVKLYLALNTLLNDDQIDEAFEIVSILWNCGIDAIIVQDIGFAELLLTKIPNIILHASTQMSIYNLEGVLFLQNMGFKRVVLARELTLSEIENIVSKSQIEIEIFVHGAICISYSGQCLMSKMIGGRSGNRGECAQPCRMSYELYNEDKKLKEGFLLSPKDLCYLDDLNKLIKIGVCSLKIEGRLKGIEYIYNITSIYRKNIDKIKMNSNYVVSNEDKELLKTSFNRDFFNGYLYGKPYKNIINEDRPNNRGILVGEVKKINQNSISIKTFSRICINDGVEIRNKNLSKGGTIIKIETKDGFINFAEKESLVQIYGINGIDNSFVNSKIYKTFDSNLFLKAEEISKLKTRKIECNAKIDIEFGQYVKLEVITFFNCKKFSVKTQSNSLIEKANNSLLCIDRIKEQIKKTGEFFDINEIIVNYSENDLFVKISEINFLRRDALEKLKEEILLECIKERNLLNNKISMNYVPIKLKDSIYNKISIHFAKKINVEIINKQKIERIYVSITEFLNPLLKDFYNNRDFELFIWFPNISRRIYDNIKNEIIEYIKEFNVDGVLIPNINLMNVFEDLNIRINVDYSFNLTNRQSVEFIQKNKIDGLTFSFENRISEIIKIKECVEINDEIIVYGSTPVMENDYCLNYLCSTKNCLKCDQSKLFLKDKKGYSFNLRFDKISCTQTIYNSKVLFLGEKIKFIKKNKINFLRLNIYNESLNEINDIINYVKNCENANYKKLEIFKSKGYTNSYESFY